MIEEHPDAQATAMAHPTHKSPNYVLIFVWLIVITAVEVAVGYIPPDIIPTVITYPALLTLAIVKVLLVALYYMHLRYDSAWFTMAVLAAIPLAVLFVLALMLGFVRK